MVYVVQPRERSRFQGTDAPWRYIGFAASVAHALQKVPVSLSGSAQDGAGRLTHMLPLSVRRGCRLVTLAYIAADVAYEGREAAEHYHLDGTAWNRHVAERTAFHAVATVGMPALMVALSTRYTRQIFIFLRCCYVRGPGMLSVGMLGMMPLGPDRLIAQGVSRLFDYGWPVNRRLEFRPYFQPPPGRRGLGQ